MGWKSREVENESFGWILLNSEFICVIGIVISYLGNWGKRVSVVKIQQKYVREREKVGERKFWISVITLLKFLLTETNCGNAIAEIGGKKFVAMPLPKMGEKKNK